VAAATRTSLRLAQEEPERRERLRDHVLHFREGARQLGIRLGAGHSLTRASPITPIHPIVLGESARALAVSEALWQRGFWVSAIRPPTVPEGSARLRVTLSAEHSGAQIDRLLEALAATVPADVR
jgi:8-amino-7-oxononanoate synthase